ncbi:hypothetical protein [Mycolicibacterium sp.]|uniref:hypothetical protein n=1 Tax=Mycolicibacterium sp. TaxID=2320850 RepID=UPI0037CC222F
MYKDTAKWLLTFTPIAAIVTLALTLAPRVGAIAATGFTHWVVANPIATAAVALTLFAAAIIVVLCSHVLLAKPRPWTELRADDEWCSKAFSDDAVGVPLFGSSTSYEKIEVAALQNDATAAEQTALAATSRRMLELSEAQNAEARFKRFIWGYGICMVIIVAGMCIATAGVPLAPDAVTKPTKVSILLPPDGESRFTEETQCATVTGTTAIAVRGLWDRPVLRLFGPGCTQAEWTPTAEILIAPK